MIKEILFIFLLCLSTTYVRADSPSSYVSNATWKQVEPYLMPDDHPAKQLLDEIVAKSALPVLYDMFSLQAAGFDFAIPQHKTKIIVTRHPKLPGYVIKAYLDTQEYYEGRPEYFYWIKRVQGANLIRKAIRKYHVEHLLKVPRKWIYPLPDTPYKAPPAGCSHKMFILIEDDMDILDDKTSEKRWRSAHATKELLYALHKIITEFGFRDCAKPANCPFSKDGRVALVDTQSFYKKRLGYYKLTPYLDRKMQKYWKSLSHVAVE